MALFKDSEKPEISHVSPNAAIPGGEFQIHGKNLAKLDRPRVLFGDVTAPIIIGSNSLVIARVPEGASVGRLVVESGFQASPVWPCGLGLQLADSMHPVANPAVDTFGNIYTTFSGSRGQKTPVSVYAIDPSNEVKPLVTDIMNATGLAVDNDGLLYVSSRYDGIVYQVTPSCNMSVYVEGMGVATGLAFDRDDNLYVGDRSGTIFKISRQRQIYVFSARWSRPLPPITWPSDRTGTGMPPARPPPALIAFIASTRPARLRPSTAAGASAGPGLRYRRQPVRGSQHRRPQGCGADRSEPFGGTLPVGAKHRWIGLRARQNGHRRHQQRDLSHRRRRARVLDPVKGWVHTSWTPSLSRSGQRC